MHYIISGGSGSKEVSRAIWLYCQKLKQDGTIEVVKSVLDDCKNCYKSVTVRSSIELKEGVYLYKFKSPFRPIHKRKRWYFEIKKLERLRKIELNESKIIYQTLRSPKKGGQHVNKTNSGVRAIYKELNIEAISFNERSQYLNKKIAKARLIKKIKELEITEQLLLETKIWTLLKNIKRGEEIDIVNIN